MIYKIDKKALIEEFLDELNISGTEAGIAGVGGAVISGAAALSGGQKQKPERINDLSKVGSLRGMKQKSKNNTRSITYGR